LKRHGSGILFLLFLKKAHRRDSLHPRESASIRGSFLFHKFASFAGFAVPSFPWKLSLEASSRHFHEENQEIIPFP
jgi:hypothetical protein